MSTDTLKPCPWCGGRALAYDVRETHGICTLECTGCNAERSGDTPELAAEAWNRRAGPPLDVSTESPKPCPFCGDANARVDAAGDMPLGHGRYQNLFVVHCGCGVEGTTCNTPAFAIAAWNRRSALMSNAAPEVDMSAECVDAARQEALTQAIRECAELSDHFDAESKPQASMGAAQCLMAICKLANPLKGKETPR